MFRQSTTPTTGFSVLMYVLVFASVPQGAPARGRLDPSANPPAKPDDSAGVDLANTSDDSQEATPECDNVKRRELYFAEAQTALHEAQAIPEWVRDAIWYYIDVPSFRNGEPTNDSPDTPPWGVKRSDMRFPRQESLYGGDLQGVRQKLPYLKQLGVNALILDGVFADHVPLDRSEQGLAPLLETLHVKDSVAVAGSLQRVSRETVDPCTWQWTESDRLLLDVASDARHQGFHVVVQYPHPTSPHPGDLGMAVYFYDYTDFLWDMNDRWLRKGTGTRESVGIDGWADAHVFSGVQNVFATWRRRIKRVNPDCVLVGL